MFWHICAWPHVEEDLQDITVARRCICNRLNLVAVHRTHACHDLVLLGIFFGAPAEIFPVIQTVSMKDSESNHRLDDLPIILQHRMQYYSVSAIVSLSLHVCQVKTDRMELAQLSVYGIFHIDIQCSCTTCPFLTCSASSACRHNSKLPVVIVWGTFKRRMFKKTFSSLLSLNFTLYSRWEVDWPQAGLVQDRSSTHTPPTCSRWYDHKWLKADYKPDSSIHPRWEVHSMTRLPVIVFASSTSRSSFTRACLFISRISLYLGVSPATVAYCLLVPWLVYQRDQNRNSY